MHPPPAKHRRRLSINSMLPSLLTLASCCAGLTAVRHAIDGQLALALLFVLSASVLDGLDGTVARWLKATSHFGGELDSLADFVAFGVCPALILYFTLFDNNQNQAIYWGLSLMFTSCCGLRLARFNVLSLNPDPNAKPEPFFRGIPAPGGGLLALMPLVLLQVYPQVASTTQMPLFSALWIVFIGLMMVSTIPTFSPKKLRISPRFNLMIVLLLLAVLLIAIENPWWVWLVSGAAYLLSIPIMAVNLARSKS